MTTLSLRSVELYLEFLPWINAREMKRPQRFGFSRVTTGSRFFFVGMAKEDRLVFLMEVSYVNPWKEEWRKPRCC